MKLLPFLTFVCTSITGSKNEQNSNNLMKKLPKTNAKEKQVLDLNHIYSIFNTFYGMLAKELKTIPHLYINALRSRDWRQCKNSKEEKEFMICIVLFEYL